MYIKRERHHSPYLSSHVYQAMLNKPCLSSNGGNVYQAREAPLAMFIKQCLSSHVHQAREAPLAIFIKRWEPLWHNALLTSSTTHTVQKSIGLI
jgi:hypothetical protein